MRELLEKAHQQDEEDLFKEEEGDEEFTAPGKYHKQRTVTLLTISRSAGCVSGRLC
jgi:hypothetical protein